MDKKDYDRSFGEEYFDHVRGLLSFPFMCIAYILKSKEEEKYND